MNGSISTAEYHAMQAGIMTEQQLQDAIIAAAQRRNWLVYHTHDSRRSQKGFPDLVLVHAGQKRVLYRELKTQRGTLRPDQKTWLAHLTAAGADASIWRPLDWFNQTVSEQLDEPLPDITAIAAELGIELLPWQVTYAENALRGNPIILDRGRAEASGNAALERLFRRFASIQPHPEGEPR